MKREKMKIKEVYVEAKRSESYNTYTLGIGAEVNEDEVDDAIVKLQRKCRDGTNLQIIQDRVNKQMGGTTTPPKVNKK